MRFRVRALSSSRPVALIEPMMPTPVSAMRQKLLELSRIKFLLLIFGSPVLTT